MSMTAQNTKKFGDSSWRVSALSSELLFSILEAIPLPFLVFDANDLVLYASPEACLLLGGKLQGESIFSAIRSPVVTDAIAQVHKTQTPLRIEYARRVPTPRFFEASILPLSPVPESSAPLLLLLRDLSAEHTLERTHNDFIAYASHELKTPLTAILGFVETLKDMPQEERDTQKRFLGLISEQGLRMQHLLEDLLLLSTLEPTRSASYPFPARPTASLPIALFEIVKQAKDMLEEFTSRQDVEVMVDVSPEYFVTGNLEELVQVVRNLLENALKYAAQGKKIRIQAYFFSEEKKELCLSIQDFGAGIAPEHLPRLTEKFYRLDQGAGDPGGVGLGLAIVEHILARHGGRLLIHSTLGEGSTFRVILPHFSE